VIVIAASTLISAVIARGSVPDRAMRHAFEADEVTVSEAILAELLDVFARLARFIDPEPADRLAPLARRRPRGSPRGFQPFFVVGTESLANLVGRNRPRWIGLHGVVDGDHVLTQPALDGRFSLLQGAQPGPHGLADRCVAAAPGQAIDVAGLLRRQADGPLLG